MNITIAANHTIRRMDNAHCPLSVKQGKLLLSVLSSYQTTITDKIEGMDREIEEHVKRTLWLSNGNDDLELQLKESETRCCLAEDKINEMIQRLREMDECLN